MKTLFTAFRVLLVLTALTGVAYPLLVTGIGQLLFPLQAAGSLVLNGNEIQGSGLIAQGFTAPKYFWPRPSAVKYDSLTSGASNQSIASEYFLKSVKEREAKGLVADLRFASASGLDPDISPEAADTQLLRVSEARKLSQDQTLELRSLLMQGIKERQLGVLGESRVNVFGLNKAIDKRFGEVE